MEFIVKKRPRITGGGEYKIITRDCENDIFSISIPVRKIKTVADLRCEISKFFEIDDSEIKIIWEMEH